MSLRTRSVAWKRGSTRKWKNRIRNRWKNATTARKPFIEANPAGQSRPRPWFDNIRSQPNLAEEPELTLFSVRKRTHYQEERFREFFPNLGPTQEPACNAWKAIVNSRSSGGVACANSCMLRRLRVSMA